MFAAVTELGTIGALHMAKLTGKAGSSRVDCSVDDDPQAHSRSKPEGEEVGNSDPLTKELLAEGGGVGVLYQIGVQMKALLDQIA